MARAVNRFTMWLANRSVKLYALARGWVVLAAFAVIYLYLALTFPALQSAPGGEIVSLDAGFFYTPAQAFSKIASYGEARIFWIVMYLTWDVLNPVLYSVGLSLFVSWVLARALDSGNPWRLLNLLPFAGGLADLLENLSIVVLMAVHPMQPLAVAWMATLFTMLKMSLLALSVLPVVPGVIAAAWHGFKVQ